MLLADDAVAGIRLGDGRADKSLDIAVAVGHQVLMALALDRQRVEAAEIAEAELPGTHGQIAGKAHARVIVVGHDVSGF